MAILVNMGKRGFVLNEGLLKPGDQITVTSEVGEKLAGMYPKELKLIAAEEVKSVKEPVKPIEPTEEKPVVKRGRPKKVQEEVK